MAACDVVVSLRSPTMGETSGTVVRALSPARPLVVSDVGWFSELPDDGRHQGGAGRARGGDARGGARAAARRRRGARTAMGAAALELAADGARRSTASRTSTSAALEEAAGGEAVREAVVREVAEAAADVGIGPDDPEAKELAARLREAGLGGEAALSGATSARSFPVPAWAWLAGIVAVSTLVRYVFGRGTVGARGSWSTSSSTPSSRRASPTRAASSSAGEATAAYGIVYPVLIAPAWALFESVPQAYAAAKAINALVMSLAAVPAYFLARRVLVEPLALVAAALTVAVPSMVYTATLMTENAFYPLFLTAALAIVLWLERPTPLRTAIVLGVCLVAYLTRQQAVALLPALLTAPLLVAGQSRVPPLRARSTDSPCRGLARDRDRPAGARALAARHLRRLRGGGPRRLLGRARWRSGSPTTSAELEPLARRDPVRRADPPGADAAPADRARPHLRRRRPQPVLLARAGGGRVRLRADVPHRGAEHVLRRAALLHRAARVDRARPAETAAGDGDWRRCSPSGCRSAIPYDDFIGLNAVSDTAALLPLGWLVEQGLALSDASLVVLAGCRRRRPRVSLRAPPLRARAAGARARLLRRVAAPDRRPASLSLGAAPVRRHRDEGSRLDRPLGGARWPTWRFVWTGTSSEFTIWENEIFSRSIGDDLHDRTGCPRRARADASLDRPAAPAIVRSADGRRVPCARNRAHRRDRSSSEAPWSARTEVKRMVLYRVRRPAAAARVRRRALPAGHVVG